MRARSAARITRCPRTATMTRSTETSSARASRRRRFFTARACPGRGRGSRSQFVILIISCNGSEKTGYTSWSLQLRVTLAPPSVQQRTSETRHRGLTTLIQYRQAATKTRKLESTKTKARTSFSWFRDFVVLCLKPAVRKDGHEMEHTRH